METAISLPFTVNMYGKVQDTTSQEKIWSDRVRSVIGTNLRERLMRPDFGTLVPTAFMETEESAQAIISEEVERAFTTQLDLLRFQTVELSFDEYSSALNVNIIYDLPNNEQVETTVSLVTLNGSNPLQQENL
jgi:phage baseplate assembly protein W